jgi:hypothetical protein
VKVEILGQRTLLERQMMRRYRLPAAEAAREQPSTTCLNL